MYKNLPIRKASGYIYTHCFYILLIVFSALGFYSCEKDEIRNATITGKVQKGPFILGTNITLNELNDNLGQTGRSFTSTINANDGSFELKNIDLKSGISLLTANGFYYSELFGELSSASLTLQTIADLSDKETVNINILTHLSKARIEQLVSDGNSFKDAKAQAESELLAFLGINQGIDLNFEDLDISADNDNNAILLALSVLIQRYTMIWNEKPSLTAELTQLLMNMSNDFKQDGQINSKQLIDTLLFNVSRANLIDIRENIEKCYSDMGILTIIPDFEKYIAIFQEKHSEYLYTDFVYPENASPEPVMAPDSKAPNILVKEDTVFVSGMIYSVAAYVPLHSELTIKFKGANNNNYSIGGPGHGWKIINNFPDGFELKSQRNNVLITLRFYFDQPGIATIEYFENDTISPAFIKNIRWE